MNAAMRLAGWVVLSLVWACGAWAQQRQEPPLAHDLREEIVHWPVTLQDAQGRSEQKDLVLTLFRPPGKGPFPVVVLNHGRAPTPQARAAQARTRFERVSRYWVAQGFAVILPSRVGYGPQADDFDPEFTGSCDKPQHAVVAKAASDQVLAAMAFAGTQADLDVTHWLVAGQSVGGLTAIATVARQPEGLLGGINFSGGTGGNPELRPGQPCAVQALADLWRQQAAQSRVPMLWLYWENDRFWGDKIPRVWHQAWLDGGGRAEFHQLPPVGSDGHNGMNQDMVAWTPLAHRFIQTLGFKFANPQTP